jgi:hypothetical protein
MREPTIPAVAELAEAFLSDLSDEQAQVLEELLLASLRAEAARVRYDNLVHDAIAAWHEATAEHPASTMELHEWLGMSWLQYRTWLEETK